MAEFRRNGGSCGFVSLTGALLAVAMMPASGWAATGDGLATAFSNVPEGLPSSGQGYYLPVGLYNPLGTDVNNSIAQPFWAEASGKLETVSCYVGSVYPFDLLEVSVHERTTTGGVGRRLGTIELDESQMPFNTQQRLDLDFSSRDIELEVNKEYFLRFQTPTPNTGYEAYQVGALVDASTTGYENVWVSPEYNRPSTFGLYGGSGSVEVAAELVVESPSGVYDRRRTVTIEPLFDASMDIESGPTLDLQGQTLVTAYTEDATDARSFMEFDLSVLPWGAGIVEARLDAYVNTVTPDSTFGQALHYIGAYPGDGSASSLDAEYGGYAVASQISTTSTGEVSYDLDIDNLIAGIGGSDILGLSTLGIYGAVGYASSEHPSLGGPVLTIEYVPQTVPGDFNEDYVLDVADLDMLRYNLGNPDYDIDGDGDADFDDMVLLVESPNGLGTIMGDANLDGVVDLLDLSLLASHFGDEGAWMDGNFNHDMQVDLLDLSILASYFGQEVVPEPSVVAVLSALVLVGRRRVA